MTWNLAQTMSLIKAAQHKYTHRKLVGRDPKTNRPRYRYYYARHHGGGITSAKFEAGSAFRLTFKGRTGHFHVESVDGDMVTVRHDGRKGSKPIEMSRDELRALLERQHSKLETKSREKAQKRRKSAAKKRKSTKRKSTKRQAPAKRPQLSVADQVEEHRGQLLDQAKALKERIEGLDKKEDKEEIARLRDEAGALSGAALLAQRAQRDGIESAGPMIKKQIEQTQRMIDRSDNAEHTARLTRDLEQKRKLLDIIEGKTQVEPERPKREKAQDETTQQAPQRSQTAQAFSGLLDAIKSGEGTQAAQRAFKTELNKVIDKTESGTLTDAERAELLPIAEQLVEVTSGRARGLMTAVRDQIKGSSEGSEEHVKIASEYVRENRPPKISQQDIDRMTEEQLIEEGRRRRAYLDRASDMVDRNAPSIKELESKREAATREYSRLYDAMNRGEVSRELFEEARDRLNEVFEEQEQHKRELSVLYKLGEVSNEGSALRIARIAASKKREKRERAAARRAAKKKKVSRS